MCRNEKIEKVRVKLATYSTVILFVTHGAQLSVRATKLI